MTVEQGPRAYGMPVMVWGGDGRAEHLRRTSLDEAELQDLIARHPGLLPLLDLDPAYEGSVAVARELRTAAGPVDVVLLNPRGCLTLVETKLWRNPEARREAVAQLLDYATRLAEWDFTDLDQEVRAAARRWLGREMGVLEVLRHQGASVPPEDEARLVDAIKRNLRDGRFLLLLVGDGIRESAERLVQFLNRYARWAFTLALVELAVYEVPPQDPASPPARLVVPHVVVRTREIMRHVIQLRGVTTAAELTPELAYEVQVEDESADMPEAASATVEDFLAQLPDSRLVPFVQKLLTDCQASRLAVEPDGRGIQVLTRIRSRGFRLFLLRRPNHIQIPEWLYFDLRKAGVPEDRAQAIAREHAGRIARLLDAQTLPNGMQLAKPLPDLARVQESYEEFMSIVRETASLVREAVGGN